MYEAQPCYCCKAKSYGMIHEIAAGLEPRHYCERHYWLVYGRVIGIDRARKSKQQAKQLNLL